MTKRSAVARYLAIACLLFCIGSVAAKLQDALVVAATLKFLASISFLACALAAGALSSTYGRAIFAGLVFSALGDALLIGTAPKWFLAGLGSFLLAHLWYSRAFWTRGVRRSSLLICALPLAVFAALVLERLWPSLAVEMRAPVIAYVAAISVMVALAFGTHAWRHNHWLWSGALGFMISDLAVAADQFMVAAPTHFIWGLPLYYLAQLLLIRSIVTDLRFSSCNYTHSLK